MSEVTIFAHKSYKEFLQSKIRGENKAWGLMTRLAQAAGCQRPYLSRVVSGEAHLTPAQALGLARFWKLSDEETDYFLGLLEIERGGSREYCEYWKRKTADLKRRHENLSKLVDREPAGGDEKDWTYYSAWYWTAIHILVSIPDYQTEKAIAEKFSLPVQQVRIVLTTLERWGAVRKENGRWRFGAREQHISRDSPLSSFHHNNWRQRAVLNSQKRDPDSIHYTVVQSLSMEDFGHLKEVVLRTIEQIAKIAGPSSEEKLVCFSCDLFEP